MASDGEDDALSNQSSSYYMDDDDDDSTYEVDSNGDDDDGDCWHPEEEEVDDDDDDDDDDEGIGTGEQANKKNAAAVDLTKIDKRYRNLSEAEVRARQDADTAKVSELFAIPRGFAAVLLRHYQWSLVELQDRLFCDGDRVGAATGVSLDGVPVSLNDNPLVCAICFVEHPAGEMRSAGCSHFYCVGCWRWYVHAAVSDGARCLSFRCPDPECSAAVVRELVDEVADDKDRARYATFLLRSYVEEGTKIKWCPGPGCTVAVEFVGGGGGEEKQDDVECKHGHDFCWRCGEEAHRPVSCKTVAMWLVKNGSESETAMWLLSHTKHCPKCRRPIEKNHGCMHMTCRGPCHHEFCWLCLEPWSGHRSCHRYRADGTVVESKVNERRRQAKASLDRYIYHYERWAANLKSRRVALRDMEKLERSELKKMAGAVRVPPTELRFVTEAYEQVGDGRRVLGWAYAYGYYLDPERDATKRRLFDYLQEDANASLERLHGCAEQDRKKLFTVEKGTAVDFDTYRAYREKLAGLTRVTRHYFENLVKAFAGDLAEVSSSS